MKRVLILCDDYYPSSRATIAITQRFAEALVEKGYKVSVLTMRERINTKPDYPLTYKGVSIFDYSDFEDRIKKSETDKISRIDKRNARLLKIIQREKKIKFNSVSSKGDSIKMQWNSFVEKKRLKHRDVYYKSAVYKRYIFYRKCIVESFLENQVFDTIVSVSGPFSTNTIACEVKKDNHLLSWISICFDPYAYEELRTNDFLKPRIKEENKVFSVCDKIMLLTQFMEDYKGSKVIDRIKYFELPNIRPLSYNSNYSSITFDREKVNCVFLGNFFDVYRHPEFLFRVVERLSDSICVHIVGGLINISREYVDEWVKKLKGKLVYHERVGQEEAINTMLTADVLVNVGHKSSNQCPSKVIEYVCTGKPIWNISKIPNCTSLPYLEKYPRQFTMFEYDEVTDRKIKELEIFLKSEKEKPEISFEAIEKLYPECTMAKMIEAFEE